MRKLKESIEKSFHDSGKKHIFITGSKQAGKTTLFRALLEHKQSYGGLITYAVRDEAGIPEYIVLQDICDASVHVIVGVKNPQGTGVAPCSEGFETTGAQILDRCLESTDEWVVIDEIGFLESSAFIFCGRIRECLQEKKVIAVLRKRSTPFIEELRRRTDAYLVDLDEV